ncbi:immunoglobulin-like domain-containing protein [Salinicoccus roseus]|uniref:immunoglobulin-like domain-containing protein n=1 Tax=Salinicoccus roseus TaxID=45670 RepID=UPI001EF52FC1|nr:immunoglobulin-like domain-containing protein [Salinicoccus roseus]MCG7333447.1 hypothetical protein [Salinicoccus roseus]
MSKNSIFVIIGFITLLLSSCITRPAPDLLDDPSPRQELPQSEDITFSLAQTTHSLPIDKVDLNITNTGTSYYTFGEFFYIEKVVEDTWYMLEIEDSNFNDFSSFDNYGYRLAPGESREETLVLSNYAFTFDPGKYRIAKAFNNEATSETIWLSAEFEVVD